MKRRSLRFPRVFLGFAALLCGPSAVLAQTPATIGPNLDRFSVLGHSGVTGSAGAGTVVIGDVGSFPTFAITNFNECAGCCSRAPGFSVFCAADPVTAAARGEATVAFLSLNQGAGTVVPAADLGIINGTGVITPGIYTFGGGFATLAGTLTFNGAGIYVIRTATTLVTTAGSNMALAGGANACNIFWQIGSSATIDSTTSLGQVFANASITVTGNMTGRAIAGANGAAGAVTMPVGGNTIGGCAAAAAPPVPALPDAAALGLLGILLASGVFVLTRR